MVEIKEIGESSNAENEANTNHSDEAVAPHSNGEAQVDQEEVPQDAPQPTRLESFFAITKSLILRALIFYFITSFFRRPATTPVEQGGAPVKLPGFNYFENGSIMVKDDEF